MSGWRQDTYRDKSSGAVTHIEVVPVSDCRQHVSSEDCECLPLLEKENGALILTHNSFDGREFSEPDYDERGH